MRTEKRIEYETPEDETGSNKMTDTPGNVHFFIPSNIFHLPFLLPYIYTGSNMMH